MIDLLTKYFLVEAVLLAAIIVLSVVLGRRYKAQQGKQIPAGFERTEEVNIDPVTKKKTRVFFNKSTGERMYREE